MARRRRETTAEAKQRAALGADQIVPDHPTRQADVLVVGAGAAGMLAALAARGALTQRGATRACGQGDPSVVLLNNEPRLGLKILVSGGGRCNVSNEQVDEHDYITDAPHLLRGVLRGFPVESVRTLFDGLGCRLYAEPLGKLFPVADDARAVLTVLLEAIQEAGIPLVAPAEVVDLVPPAAPGEPWRAVLEDGREFLAKRVVLATGGKSLPKTGSRGFGFDALAGLGHTIEAPLPALTPVRLAPGRLSAGPLEGLAGLTVPACLTLAARDAQPEQLSGSKLRPVARSAGSLLITHQGVSGPVGLDVSGACGRALQRGDALSLRGDFWSLTQHDSPWAPFLELDKLPGASLRPSDAPRPPTLEVFRSQLKPLLGSGQRGLVAALSQVMPRSLAQALLAHARVDGALPSRQHDKPTWRRVHLALTQVELPLSGTDGYSKAEVTVGGVLLAELARNTLESKRAAGLFVCGEVAHVTGRLGGFNFQWAWASGFAAGSGARASLEV